MSVSEYAVKFEELPRFCPYINAAGVEVSKCLKFENELRPEIKQFIEYEQIRQFSVLVTTRRIYEGDNKATSSHCNAVSEKKERDQSRGKPYNCDLVLNFENLFYSVEFEKLFLLLF